MNKQHFLCQYLKKSILHLKIKNFNEAVLYTGDSLTA